MITSGARVAQYRILDKIGEGGMGAVWKARDEKLGRIVALKFLSRVDSHSRERFQLEARAVSSLNHPSIVTIHEILEQDGQPCIVMEYVNGIVLDDFIQYGGMPYRDVIRFGIQIADALHTAHHAGIIHRDLKPSNVIVTANHRIKLLDFGLVKLVDSAPLRESTQNLAGTQTVPGAIVGTASYMSPEQAEGKPVDVRTDIFSFGALLYEMATGRKAFPGDSAPSTMAAILRDDPKPISQELGGTLHDLDRVISRCLRKNPGRRFQTAMEVRNALEDLRDEMEGRRQAALSIPALRKWLPWAVAGLALAAIGGLIWIRRAKPADTAAAPLIVRPLTSLPGRKDLPVFSPDGNIVAFAWDGGQQGQNSDVYLMQLDGGRPLQVTTHAASEWPSCFSPDGRRLYFNRQSASGFTSYWVPTLGGDETRVAEGVITDIAPDGQSAVLVRLNGSQPGEQGIFVLQLFTGNERRLGENFGAMDPKFSADGKWVYISHGPNRDRVSLHRVPAGGGQPEQVQFSNLDDDVDRIEGIRFAPRHTRMLIEARAKVTNARILYVANADGSDPKRLPSSVAAGALSPDGRQMVSVRNAFVVRPYRVEAFPAPKHPAIPELLLDSPFEEYSPRISPDGRRLLISSFRKGRWGIWSWDIAMKDGHPLFDKPGGTAGSPAWSPDGKWIAFDARTEHAAATLWIAESAGGEPRKLDEHSGDDITPCFDPASQWVYFTSNRTGTLQLFRVPVSGGPATQVTQGGAFTCQFSSDGRQVYYLKTRNGGEIWRLDLATSREEPVVPEMKSRNWKVLRDGIYMMDSQTNSQIGTAARVADAKFYRFATKTIEDLGFRTQRAISFIGIDLSPDERWLYYSQVDGSISELLLVENLP